MKIILHIGSEKTGSTSIQSAMFQNDALLRDNGVYFLGWSNRETRWHTFLPLLLGKRCLNLGLFDHEEHRFERFQASLWKDWERIEQDIAAQRPRVLVLSSEIAFRQMDAQPDRFVNRLKALSSDIEVVAYLRSPESFAKSLILQTFKQSTYLGTAELATSLSFDKVLRQYEQLFDGNLRVFNYDSDRADYGSVVTPFFQRLLGMTPPDQATRIFWNVTMSPDLLSITQRYFSRYYGCDKWFFDEHDHQILGKLLRLEATVGKGHKTYTPLARQLVRHCMPDVAALNRTYDLGFPDHQVPPETGGNAGLPDQLTLRDIFELDEARIAALHQRIEAEMPRFWRSYGDTIGARLDRRRIRFKRRAKRLYNRYMPQG